MVEKITRVVLNTLAGSLLLLGILGILIYGLEIVKSLPSPWKQILMLGTIIGIGATEIQEEV